MNGNCHFLFGISITSMIALNLPSILDVSEVCSLVQFQSPDISSTATLLILGGLLGSIFPDIDNPNSYMGKLSSPISTIIGKISALFGKTDAKHRGIFHDAGIYLIGLLLSVKWFSPLSGFFLGCLSHVFLDAFNPAGVPFLFGIKHIHLGRIVSGSKKSILFSSILNVMILAIGISAKFFVHF